MNAVAYLRVSTTEQANEGCSLAAQLERVRAYCVMAGLELVTVYREEGVSGSKPLDTRPQGRQLAEALRNSQATHVVAMKLDRLFRDAVDCLTATREWDRAGTTLHLVDMGGTCLNTGSAMGRMFLTMAAGFAELERNLISERTTTAMTHLKAEGRHVGSPAMGFEMVAGQLVANEVEKLAVQRALELRESSLTLREIAAQLEAEGHPTKRGGKWGPSVVREILTRSQ
jgi:DNA invertase Pin-like site-specific DNA recombinase